MKSYENKLYTLIDKVPTGPYVYILMDGSKEREISIIEYGITLQYEPFYIGKGNNKRFRCHFHKSVLNKSNNKRYNKIKKINREGYKVAAKFIELLDDKMCYNTEIDLIKIVGREDKNCGPLVNRSDGGEGWNGVVYTDKMKERYSKAQKGKKLGIENGMARKVYKYTLNGEYIEEYGTVKDACKSCDKLGKSKSCSVSNAVAGRLKTAYGYQWKGEYQGDKIPAVIVGSIKRATKGKPGTYSKKIVKLSKIDDSIVKVYDSIKEAMTDSGLSAQVIWKSANDLSQKRCRNYYWRYPKDI